MHVNTCGHTALPYPTDDVDTVQRLICCVGWDLQAFDEIWLMISYLSLQMVAAPGQTVRALPSDHICGSKVVYIVNIH